jgi:hypothetical protein
MKIAYDQGGTSPVVGQGEGEVCGARENLGKITHKQEWMLDQPSCDNKKLSLMILKQTKS